MAKSSTFKYEITLHPPRGLNLKEVYSDVLYTVFVRTPPAKAASFVIVRINMPMVIIQQIQNDVNDNNYTVKHHWYMDIWQIDETERSKGRRFKLIFRKPYIVLGCKIYDSTDMATAQRRHVQLIMVNPVIHELSSTNDYNKILQNVTGLNAIKDYESALTDQHGEMFNFNRIGAMLNINNFNYEQIFVPASVDSLHIPQYLIHTYKPYDSFNYYFFDDFHFTSNKNVVCHHINIYDRSVFKKFDVSRFADSSVLTHEIGRFDLNDTELLIDKKFEDTTPTFRGREIKTDEFKRVKSKILKHVTSGSISDELTENRSIQTVQKTDISQKTVQRSSQFINAYTPDDTKTAESRLIKIRETIKKKIDRIFYFEAINALVDFPSFGYLYNMESDNRTSYSYTPLSIINVFTRIAEKDEILVHNPRFSMIRFTEPSDASIETEESFSSLTLTTESVVDEIKTQKKKVISVINQQIQKAKKDIAGVLTTNKPEFPTTLNDIIQMPESFIQGYRTTLDKAKDIVELWTMYSQLPINAYEHASQVVKQEFINIVNEYNRRQAVIRKATKDSTNIKNIGIIKDISELTDTINILKQRLRR